MPPSSALSCPDIENVETKGTERFRSGVIHSWCSPKVAARGVVALAPSLHTPLAASLRQNHGSSEPLIRQRGARAPSVLHHPVWRVRVRVKVLLRPLCPLQSKQELPRLPTSLKSTRVSGTCLRAWPSLEDSILPAPGSYRGPLWPRLGPGTVPPQHQPPRLLSCSPPAPQRTTPLLVLPRAHISLGWSPPVATKPVWAPPAPFPPSWSFHVFLQNCCPGG